MSMEGPELTIQRVNRLHMGAYLCIASNGVPPTVSKRVMLIVHCKLAPNIAIRLRNYNNYIYDAVPPMIWVQNQLVGAYEGQRITLECQSEAYPKSINYWTREKGEVIPKGTRIGPKVFSQNSNKCLQAANSNRFWWTTRTKWS